MCEKKRERGRLGYRDGPAYKKKTVHNPAAVTVCPFKSIPGKRIMGNPVRLRERVESLHVYVLGREDGVDEGLVEAVEGASEKNICVHKKKWKLTMK